MGVASSSVVIAFVPILESDKRFGWGLWAEVSGAVFKRYLELYKVDARDEPIAAELAPIRWTG